MTRVEAGRVCVVCTRTKFSLFSSGLECSVCRYAVCRQCTGSGGGDTYYPSSGHSLPSSPVPPSSSITSRLGTLFSKRRSSVSETRATVMCRPCLQFVQQMNLMTEEDEDQAKVPTERSM